jgi:hypothetical protein
MKLKMAADRVLKRFWRENRKEDAIKEQIGSISAVRKLGRVLQPWSQ